MIKCFRPKKEVTCSTCTLDNLCEKDTSNLLISWWMPQAQYGLRSEFLQNYHSPTLYKQVVANSFYNVLVICPRFWKDFLSFLTFRLPKIAEWKEMLELSSMLWNCKSLTWMWQNQGDLTILPVKQMVAPSEMRTCA